MGTIEKRGKNSWRIGVQLPVSMGHGWERRTLKYPPTMTEAQQRHAAEVELARLTLQLEDIRVSPGYNLTVREIYDQWIRDHVDVNCAPTTAANYKHLMEGRILPVIGEELAHQLTPTRVTQLLNGIRTESKKTTAIPAAARKRQADRDRPEKKPAPLSANSVRHYYDVLNYMFNKAVQWQLLPENVMARVDRPKLRKKKIKYLNDDQAVDLLRKLANEEHMAFRAAVLLGLLCGLRLGEVGALRLSDVDWENCTINVERAQKYTAKSGSYIDLPKSDAGVREVTLPAGMMTVLEETRKYQEEAKAILVDRWRGDGRIVCQWDGTPYHHDTPSGQFRKFADKNGFEGITFHALRHTHATILLSNNLDAVAVAARLGHESPETTLRNYAHAIKRRDIESANAMQALLDRAKKPD